MSTRGGALSLSCHANGALALGTISASPKQGRGGECEEAVSSRGVGRARHHEHLGLGLTWVACWDILERFPVQGSTEDDKDFLNWQKGAFAVQEGWEAI